jgi:broad specificity phosphatase PhoE
LSTLYLVRHGQASFGRANYDKLSELGEKQCRTLGEYWVNREFMPDAVYTGTLDRQIKSAALVSGSYQEAGLSFPAVSAEIAGFNEYDTAGILTGSIPDLIAKHPDVLEMMKKAFPDGKPDLVGNKKDFQRVFARVMDLWVAGKLSVKGLESWQDFTARVNDAISRVIEEQGSGKTVVVFTSGGPISAAVQRALQTADKVSMDIGWAIINSSISEFRYSGDRFSMVTFNETPHIRDGDMISHR